jgi:hypothetical protein
MGHKAAARALAHMVYDGRGGLPDKVLGLLILWSAFRRGDHAALEEFSDLLISFGEDTAIDQQTMRAAYLSQSLEVAVDTLDRVNEFMGELAMKRSLPPEGE